MLILYSLLNIISLLLEINLLIYTFFYIIYQKFTKETYIGLQLAGLCLRVTKADIINYKCFSTIASQFMN